MRVAIIGYSGAGKTTLARVLAAQLGVHRTCRLEEASAVLGERSPVLVLDGIPTTVAELEQLDARSPTGAAVEHVLYLSASGEARLRRISRMAVAGVSSVPARNRMLEPSELDDLYRYLDRTGRLIVIDADGSRAEVVARALEALGVLIESP